MSLFKTTAEIKVFCPTINRNMEWATLSPTVDQAERKYILPLLGKEQFEALVAAYTAGNLTDHLQSLLPQIQRPLAYYAFYELLPLLTTMVSDMGVQEQESREGTSTPARQWVFQQNRDTALENADTFADALLEFLEENYNDYPLWKNSDAFTLTKELFINTSDGYNGIVPIGRSKRVWLALRPFVRMAESEYLLPVLSQPLFADLKAKLLASLGSPLSDEYQTLLKKTQQALAWLALYKALPFQAVRFTSGGIVQTTRNTGIRKQAPADRTTFETAMAHAENNGMSALRSLEKFLHENANGYPLYDNPDSHAAPSYEIPDNRGKNSFMV